VVARQQFLEGSYPLQQSGVALFRMMVKIGSGFPGRNQRWTTNGPHHPSSRSMRWCTGVLLMICLTTPREISPSDVEHSQAPSSFLASSPTPRASALRTDASPAKTKRRAEDTWEERQMGFFHKAVEEERMLLFKSEGPSYRPPPDDKEAR